MAVSYLVYRHIFHHTAHNPDFIQLKWDKRSPSKICSKMKKTMSEAQLCNCTTGPGYWLYNLNHFSDRNQFGHQVAVLALPQHCLCLFFWQHQLVCNCYLHQPESHQLSPQKVESLRETRIHRSDQGYLGPIKIPFMGLTKSMLLFHLFQKGCCT